MTYETWRTVDAPLTDSRIKAMDAGEAVHLILWPGTAPSTRYVIEQSGQRYLMLVRKVPNEGHLHWVFLDHNGSVWDAHTKDDGLAHATTLTRRNL